MTGNDGTDCPLEVQGRIFLPFYFRDDSCPAAIGMNGKATGRGGFSWKLQGSIYGTAFFTGNLFPMSHVVMPLWALELGASPLMIGIIVSSRQILPITLSIHGGALLDRFGPRQVIMVLGVVGAASTMLFPVAPWIWAVILLQMIIGFAETTSWIGAQSSVGQLLRGQAVYAGRMTSAARIGGCIGPVVLGFSWVEIGSTGGFLVFALWSLGGAIAAFFLPPLASHNTRPTDMFPRVSDYLATFRLLLLPVIAFVIMATFLRQTGSGIQAAFYAVWLDSVGYTSETIGLLIGIGNGVSALAALTIGGLRQRIADHWLLVLSVGMAIVGIAFTPMIEGFVLLACAIGLRGAGQGLNLPLMMSIAFRATSPDLQGRITALRVSFNRLGNALFPILMGGLAEWIGLESSFYVVGTMGVLLLCIMSIWVAQSRHHF